MFNHLFSPLTLGRVILPNRICFLAHRSNFAERGFLGDRQIAYYRRRAEGGCGLIILDELCIQPNDRPWESVIDAYDSKVIPDYLRLTKAVHDHGTRVFALLNHHGFQSSGAITREVTWGPSAMSDIAFGETCKAMETADMRTVVESFSGAARYAREGGFDGLEIDMGPESLLKQFLSPLTNHRQDEYGGSIEKRMRFPLEVLDGIRKEAGADFTVGIRLCADEKFWGGITLEDSQFFAQQFERTGHIDFIDVSLGVFYNLYLVLASMHMPVGFTVELAEGIKRCVRLPIIASYQIGSPQKAEEILSQGKADAIGFVRELLCDPDFPNKARDGHPEDIRYCVRDNKGCIGRVNQNKFLGCIQNPEVGYEFVSQDEGERRTYTRIHKRVIVVGGGPAGLEAARSARMNGHEVAVYERDADLGGQINLIVKRPGRQGMMEIIRYLRHELKKLDVPVFTSFNVTAEWLHHQHPDVVIVATGSTPIEKPIPGSYGPPSVLNVWEALREQYPIGEKVLYVDENGGHHATATVEWLVDKGKKVDMVTSDLFIGMELAPLGDLYLTRQRLLQKGATFTTDIIVDEIEGTLVKGRYIYMNQPVFFQGHDTVIIDMGNRAEDQLYHRVKRLAKEVYRVGDCVAPRGIDMAFLEGRRLGERL